MVSKAPPHTGATSTSPKSRADTRNRLEYGALLPSPSEVPDVGCRAWRALGGLLGGVPASGITTLCGQKRCRDSPYGHNRLFHSPIHSQSPPSRGAERLKQAAEENQWVAGQCLPALGRAGAVQGHRGTDAPAPHPESVPDRTSDGDALDVRSMSHGGFQPARGRLLDATIDPARADGPSRTTRDGPLGATFSGRSMLMRRREPETTGDRGLPSAPKGRQKCHHIGIPCR